MPILVFSKLRPYFQNEYLILLMKNSVFSCAFILLSKTNFCKWKTLWNFHNLVKSSSKHSNFPDLVDKLDYSEGIT